MILPPTINTLSEPIISADDTKVIISSKNFYNFCIVSNTVLCHMSIWFTSNKLVLYSDKTNKIKFITNKSPQYALNIGNDEKYIKESITQNSLVYKLITT
jgi:hypothetical protein